VFGRVDQHAAPGAKSAIYECFVTRRVLSVGHGLYVGSERWCLR